MLISQENYNCLLEELLPFRAKLVAVSKTQPEEAIKTLYDFGQRDFGENYVRELSDKQKTLPPDIHWHFIGHLQSNKVRVLSDSVSLIHGIDSLKLLQAVNEQAKKNKRVQSCLLQVHIAKEETKFGFTATEIEKLFMNLENENLFSVRLEGFMGMATNTADQSVIRSEYRFLKNLYDRIASEYKSTEVDFKHLSMGMTSDYKIALEEGSTMVRIGSALFGERMVTK